MSHRWERSREYLDCLMHGHRGLSPAAAYGEILGGANGKELRYCGACGGPVWKLAPPNLRQPKKWADAGLPEDHSFT